VEKVLRGIWIDKKKSLNEEVYDSLKKSILHGKLKAGQRLLEEQLAHRIGISRTPVREAFHRLERDELVIRLPRRGFAVREFTKEDVEEIFGICGTLESYAFYRATLHLTPGRIATLKKKIEELEKAFKNKSYDKVVQLHTDFYNLLYKSCRSKKLLNIIDNFRDYFYRYRSALLQTKDGFKHSIDDYRSLLEAMKKKNPRLVERIVRKHLAREKEAALGEIKKR
jgi:DNA-binding GntR family transcriptional regulator